MSYSMMEANRPLTTVRKYGWGAQRERLTQTFPRQRKRLFAFSWPAHFSLCLSLFTHTHTHAHTHIKDYFWPREETLNSGYDPDSPLSLSGPSKQVLPIPHG